MKALTDNAERLPAAFVTYGWCRSAYTVVRSLAKRGVTVHVGDNSALAMSRVSRYTRSFTRLPDFFAEPQQYISALREAIIRTGAEVLLPCSEDIELVIRHREELPEYVQVVVPALSDWVIAEDKRGYIERVKRVGCPVPETFDVESTEHLQELARKLRFPVLVKVRMGNGARGVRVVENRELLENEFFKIVSDFDLKQDRWPVVQEMLCGRKIQMDGLFNKGKHVGTGVYEVLKSKGADNFGTSIYRITVDEPEVLDNAIKAMAALNWHGIYNIEWVYDAKGTARLIDINGRLGGAVAIVYEAGLDLPWIWYQIALGREELDVGEFRVGVKGEWVLGEAIALVEHLASGRFRESLSILRPKNNVVRDDFLWSDPLPFVFELVDYFVKFARSRGSIRPVTKGMVR